MRIALALVVVLAITTTAGIAAADGIYYTESLGGTDVKDELAASVDNAVRLRLGLGVRIGQWAVEGWLGAYFSTGNPGRRVDPIPYGDSPKSGPAGRDFDLPVLGGYGLDLKYISPVSEHVELYLRGSASYGVLDSYGGRGLGLGAGAQLKGKVRALGLLFWPLFFVPVGPKITGAVFVDAGYDFYRLHPGKVLDEPGAIDAQLTSLTGGVAFGTDF